MRITVHGAAEQTGLSVHTIRYYLREGLLPTVERDRNGVRLFTQDDLELIYRIEFLKSAGLSILEIRDFIALYLQGDATLEDRLAILRRKPGALRKQIRALYETLETAEYLIWYHERCLQEGSLSSLESIPVRDIPVEHRAAKLRLDEIFPGLEDPSDLADS